MRVFPLLPVALGLGLGLVVNACNCGEDPLADLFPHMKVSPAQVAIDNAPVSQDTRIVVQVLNDTLITLNGLHAELQEPADPSFRIEAGTPDEVLGGQTAEVVVVVRPRTITTLNAVLVLTAQEDAKPSSRVEVPIVVTSIDAGLPDICDYPDAIEFGLVGKNDVARESVTLKNCGVRDLIIDSVEFCPAGGTCGDAAFPVRLTTTLPSTGTPVPPLSSMALDLVFSPPDLEEHGGDLVIHSNDPDEEPVVIPVVGQGSACPTAVAELVDDAESIEPFDIVRLSGDNSLAANGDPFVGRYEWTLLQQPLGSNTALIPDDASHTEIETDVAGTYVAQLQVYETVPGVEGEIRSCQPATVTFDVKPTEDLLVQLVWDHPSADLDLHMVRDGGEVFNHDDDCYFSNRAPDWYDVPEQNPNLDHDDHDGYGPENLNVVAPAPGSHWQVYVHYWNKQTDGDARTSATVRVFVYGQQVIEVSRTFEEDQQMWQALDITWPEEEGGPAALSQIGVVEPFPRPF